MLSKKVSRIFFSMFLLFYFNHTLAIEMDSLITDYNGTNTEGAHQDQSSSTQVYGSYEQIRSHQPPQPNYNAYPAYRISPHFKSQQPKTYCDTITGTFEGRLVNPQTLNMGAYEKGAPIQVTILYQDPYFTGEIRSPEPPAGIGNARLWGQCSGGFIHDVFIWNGGEETVKCGKTTYAQVITRDVLLLRASTPDGSYKIVRLLRTNHEFAGNQPKKPEDLNPGPMPECR